LIPSLILSRSLNSPLPKCCRPQLSVRRQRLNLRAP
jgi:hypothetical protein